MSFTRPSVSSARGPVAGSAQINGRSHAGLALPPSADTLVTLQRLFHQLGQSLAVLRNLAVMVGAEGGALPRPALQLWLPANARQAEQAMHDLRDMRVITSPALTDLSQHLTVLVLAADMLSQGHLSGADAQAFYELLQRNTEGALAALHGLRAQCGLEA